MSISSISVGETVSFIVGTCGLLMGSLSYHPYLKLPVGYSWVQSSLFGTYMSLMSMSKLVPVKLMLPRGMVDKIDRLVESEEYASRADFGHKAVFILLASIDGTMNGINATVQDGEKKRTSA